MNKIKVISAVALLASCQLAQAAIYNINSVGTGSSGFGASLFHDASGSTVQSGTKLADISTAGPFVSSVFGTFDDVTGDFNATIGVSTGGSFTLSGTGFLFNGGALASDNQLSISFTNPYGVLQDDEIGFGAGYVCCGGTNQDPNSFVADGSNMVMTLWGANFGGGTFAGVYDDSLGNRLATYGMDLRLNMSPVPVPAAVWLFGSGLLGLAGLMRRRKS